MFLSEQRRAICRKESLRANVQRYEASYFTAHDGCPNITTRNESGKGTGCFWKILRLWNQIE